MESRNYNHPSVCRLRHACLLQAGSISAIFEMTFI